MISDWCKAARVDESTVSVHCPKYRDPYGTNIYAEIAIVMTPSQYHRDRLRSVLADKKYLQATGDSYGYCKVAPGISQSTRRLHTPFVAMMSAYAKAFPKAYGRGCL